MAARCLRWLPEVTAVEMRKTFVLWVSKEPATGSDPRKRVLEGRLEDVDTGDERRFQSLEQLMSFLEEGLSDDEQVQPKA